MERGIIATAVQEINRLQNVECTVLDREFRQGNKRVDAKLRLKIGQEVIEINVEVKNKIVPAQIPNLMRLKEEVGQIMVMAHYITPNAKEILKQEQMPYADTAGNIFLNINAIYILVDNKKAHLDRIESKNRAFTAAGLKVIYQFVLHPEYINYPYRFIGEKATVTIRTVGKTLEGLVNEKYILKENKKKYLIVNQEKLLHQWVTEYNKTLRPKLTIKKFRWRKRNDNWKYINLPEKTFWGGPAAAEIMTEYLIADKWTIYTGIEFIEIMEKLQLIPDKTGNVEVIQKFWNKNDRIEKPINHNITDLVHPILVYADLIEDPNTRYVETAKMIYDEYVENRL